jgi:hypothetical protein
VGVSLAALTVVDRAGRPAVPATAAVRITGWAP